MTKTYHPLQTQGPFQFTDSPKVVYKKLLFLKLTFVGQIVQLKSSDGDGFRNEARYTWSTKLITPGKGLSKRSDLQGNTCWC